VYQRYSIGATAVGVAVKVNWSLAQVETGFEVTAVGCETVLILILKSSIAKPSSKLPLSKSIQRIQNSVLSGIFKPVITVDKLT